MKRKCRVLQPIVQDCILKSIICLINSRACNARFWSSSKPYYSCHVIRSSKTGLLAHTARFSSRVRPPLCLRNGRDLRDDPARRRATLTAPLSRVGATGILAALRSFVVERVGYSRPIDQQHLSHNLRASDATESRPSITQSLCEYSFVSALAGSNSFTAT
jgi:hypothetical protein